MGPNGKGVLRKGKIWTLFHRSQRAAQQPEKWVGGLSKANIRKRKRGPIPGSRRKNQKKKNTSRGRYRKHYVALIKTKKRKIIPNPDEER